MEPEVQRDSRRYSGGALRGSILDRDKKIERLNIFYYITVLATSQAMKEAHPILAGHARFRELDPVPVSS